MKQKYGLYELGPKDFTYKGHRIIRTDFHVINERKNKIECSLYTPNIKLQHYPCIVYLHGNCGSRKDSLSIVKQFVPHKMAVLSFDFAGCGMSTGDYISLGWFERKDTELILVKLKALFPQITDIVLWGRSMGAVTALLYSGNNP